MSEMINESWEEASPLLAAKVTDFFTALGVKKVQKRVRDISVRHRSGPMYKDGGLRTARMIMVSLRMKERKFLSKLENHGHFTDEEFDDEDRPDFFVVRKVVEGDLDVLYELANGGYLSVIFDTEGSVKDNDLTVTLYKDKAAAATEYSSRILHR